MDPVAESVVGIIGFISELVDDLGQFVGGVEDIGVEYFIATFDFREVAPVVVAVVLYFSLMAGCSGQFVELVVLV